MKPILYNISSIRAPLSGIGRYIKSLLDSKSDYCRKIYVGHANRLFQGSSLKHLLSSLENQSEINRNTKFRIDGLNTYLGRIPYSRDIYRWNQNRQFQKLVEAHGLANGVLHDLNYSFGFTLPTPVSSRVTTIYDLSHLQCPETHPRYRVQYLQRYFKTINHCESPIITISQTVKEQLINSLDVEENRIHVTHLAAGREFYPRRNTDIQKVLAEYALRYRRYILWVNTLEPRKNLITALKAYERLSQNLKDSFPFIICGSPGWKNSETAEYLSRMITKNDVKVLKYVPQAALPQLYAGAAAFVYPSLYEGFGLPLLEAMQSGCPSIISKDPALTEVAAGSALQVDALDSDALAESLTLLLNDSQLAKKHSALGIERAKDFSWKKTVDETHKIYNSL